MQHQQGLYVFFLWTWKRPLVDFELLREYDLMAAMVEAVGLTEGFV